MQLRVDRYREILDLFKNYRHFQKPNDFLIKKVTGIKCHSEDAPEAD